MNLLVPTIQSDTIAVIVVSILLILILTKNIRDYLSTRPTKEERLKELRERVLHWRTKLEYAYTAFTPTSDEEKAFVSRHKRFVNQNLARLNASDLEILFQQISIALNRYPEHIRNEALAQGESKGNASGVKEKKTRHSTRVSVSSTQKAVPLGDRWK